jgi:uncharacterized protein with FMN-binding domain
MRTRVIVGSSVGVAAALTVGWIIGTASTTGTASSPAMKLADGTYQGTTEQTRYGPVQVEIIISGGKIAQSKSAMLPPPFCAPRCSKPSQRALQR